MLKAGAAAAVALTLLVPTFNALNNSYVEDVPPPPWMPTPDEPPNITPPPDFKPPPDFQPPPGYEGEVPPACPPPIVRSIDDANLDQQLPTNPSWSVSRTFVIPNGTIGFRIYVNYTNWRAQSIAAEFGEMPDDMKPWSRSEQGQAGGLLLAQATPETRWEYDSYTEEAGQPPKAGDYTLELSASVPFGGNVQTEAYMMLACGGLFS